MRDEQFTFKTLEECIQKACEQLNIRREDLEYEVIEEKTGFFNKKATILVKVPESNEENQDEKLNEKSKEGIKGIDGKVRVEEGKIIITNPIGNGKPATIIPPQNLKIFVEGKEIQENTEVYAETNIKLEDELEDAKRYLTINTDNKKINAYVTIKYLPKYIYGLKDLKDSNSLKLQEYKKDEIYPPIYTKEELENELKKNRITYGIMEENIIKCLTKDGIENMLIAAGKEPVNGKDDKLEIKFKINNKNKSIDEDIQRVDFKNLNSISQIKKGEILAIKHNGQDGQDGQDITGKILKSKVGKKISLKVGSGCSIQGNTVVSEVVGRPEYKNGIFYVYPIYEVGDDVDIKTGNINFIGEVSIRGNVKEGMKVEAQGDITIEQNVVGAEIEGKADVTVKKNLILSKVMAGGQDIYLLKEIEYLTEIMENVIELKTAAQQIKDLTHNSKDGEIIKVLIENKFRAIPKLYFKLFGCHNCEDDTENVAIKLIKNKLIGFAPLNIKNVFELHEVIEALEERINLLKENVVIPVNVNINYSQDSTILSSGNVYITGKGEYVSEITANDSVYFTGNNSVARGGFIKAKNKIECDMVGSEGGVVTKLQVEKDGHINVKRAYQNTTFIVGNREYILDSYSKHIHAYLDADGDLSVDKIKGGED